MAPTPPLRPITTIKARSGHACRWSSSRPARLRWASAARAGAKDRSPRSAPAAARSWELCCVRPAERRVLMAAGMGAGIAAIFRPVAGALFASEVLYSSSDFESEVIMPACLASVTAYSTLGLAYGWKPLFTYDARGIRSLAVRQPAGTAPLSAIGDIHGGAGHDLCPQLLLAHRSVPSNPRP